MNVMVVDHEIPYTGRELRTGWVREASGLEGEAAVGFVGPCRVNNEDLVDMEDAEAGTFIEAELMAHVLAEHPGCNIAEGVLRQRMLVCLLCEILGERFKGVQRSGDDVYYDGRKLTVSIAAPSPGGCMIHLGINVRPEGAPVPAVGLEDMGVDPHELLRRLLDGYDRELRSCAHAQTKVKAIS